MNVSNDQFVAPRLSWWSGPCGGREVLTLALPLVVATMSWTVMNFIDRMFLLWYSKTAMAAAMPAGMLHFAMICFPLGVVSYANTFVAQYEGNGQPWRLGPAVWQAVWLAIFMTPLFLLSIPFARLAFTFAGHEGTLLDLETIYFQIMAWGAGATVLSAAMATFYTGRGATRVVMLVDTSAAITNIVLDYVMIFGRFGVPEMGMDGAAWATVIALWSKVVIYLVLILSPKYAQKYQTRTWQIDWQLLKRLCRFGAPSGLQMLVEILAITLFIMLIGELGEEAMIVTTLAFSVNSVAFMPMLGLGIAVSTIVGQQLGQDRPDLAARGTWNAYRIAVIYSGMMALLYLFGPDLFLLGHRSGMDPAQFEQLRELTVLLLRFVAAYCLFDATAITFVSAIKGAGDTRFILIITLFTAIPPVIIGWIGINWFDLGLIWCWTVITGWICSLGVVYLLRFLQGKWRTMRVIEPLVEPLISKNEIDPLDSATADLIA